MQFQKCSLFCIFNYCIMQIYWKHICMSWAEQQIPFVWCERNVSFRPIPLLLLLLGKKKNKQTWIDCKASGGLSSWSIFLSVDNEADLEPFIFSSGGGEGCYIKRSFGGLPQCQLTATACKKSLTDAVCVFHSLSLKVKKKKKNQLVMEKEEEESKP